MAWYPGARKMELQPESDAQAAIVPTQFIVHSIAAPWTVQRIYEYWRDSTNLESHFGLAYDGDIGQFIGTETRADANASANVRAVSIETASNLDHTDPWTSQQVEQLVRLGVWLHQRHGIPLRICRSDTDPGYGYHGLFGEWSLGGTACPGPERIRQFKEVVFPEIKRRAEGGAPVEEDDMPYTPEQLTAIVSEAVKSVDVRDTIAYAVWYKLNPIFDAVFAAVEDSKLTPEEIAAAYKDGVLKVELTILNN